MADVGRTPDHVHLGLGVKWDEGGEGWKGEEKEVEVGESGPGREWVWQWRCMPNSNPLPRLDLSLA